MADKRHTLAEFCEAMTIVDSELNTVLKALEAGVSDPGNLEPDDEAFLTTLQAQIADFLVAVTDPLKECMKRHHFIYPMDGRVHPFGGPGC